MREIPKKNYMILAVLILVTVLITLVLSNIYLNREKLVSNFYNNNNTIRTNDFDEYLMEYSDLIIYISDKYDLSHESFEKKFEKKLIDLNLKNNLVYIDKNELDKKFLKKLKEEYDLSIDLKKTPLIVVIIDKKVIKSTIVTNESNVDTIINYEAFQ